MPRITTAEGFKYQNKKGTFYVGFNTDAYKIHIAFGRITFTIERSEEYHKERRARIYMKRFNVPTVKD